MTVRGAKSRPAWRGMGWWKWPSILPVIFCIGMVVPYAYTGGGGANGLEADSVQTHLNECPFDYRVEPAGGTLTVMGRLAPECASALTLPKIQITNGRDAILSEGQFSGGPNGLRARLIIPSDALPDQLKVLVTSEAPDGKTVRADIPVDFAHLETKELSE